MMMMMTLLPMQAWRSTSRATLARQHEGVDSSGFEWSALFENNNST